VRPGSELPEEIGCCAGAAVAIKPQTPRATAQVCLFMSSSSLLIPQFAETNRIYTGSGKAATQK
jgi:hypothetical protein